MKLLTLVFLMGLSPRKISSCLYAHIPETLDAQYCNCNYMEKELIRLAIIKVIAIHIDNFISGFHDNFV